MLKASSVEHIAKLHSSRRQSSRKRSSRKRSMHVTGHFTKTEVSIRTHPDTRRQARPWKKLLHTEGEQDGTGPRRRRQARPRRAAPPAHGSEERTAGRAASCTRSEGAARSNPGLVPHDNSFYVLHIKIREGREKNLERSVERDTSTCTAHSGATKAHDWMVSVLGPLHAGQRRGDVEVRSYLRDQAGS